MELPSISQEPLRSSPRGQLTTTARFFREWLRDPLAVAALAPSGRILARQMAKACGSGLQQVVELGGGTGVITEALLECGVPRQGLLVLERNRELHQHLASRFPGVAIELADAMDLAGVVERAAGLEVGKVDAVASSLGLVSLPAERQRRLLAQVFEVLRPGGRFVQFTYLPRCPVPEAVRRELGLRAHRVSWSLRNLPPAFVYVLRRRRQAAEAPPRFTRPAPSATTP